jgi:parvulin-like peptidyl-prolyl isomerase
VPGYRTAKAGMRAVAGMHLALDGESQMAKSSKKSKHTTKEAKQTKKQIAFSRKEARQNRIILIAVGLLIAVIVVVLGMGIVRELILKPGQPVATVNQVKIPTDEFQDMVNYNRYNLYLNLSYLQNSIDELSASPEDNAFLISIYEQQLEQIQSSLSVVSELTLDDLIDDELIRQQAEEEGLTVTPAEVEQAITEDIRQNLSVASQEPLTGTEQLPTPTPVSQEQIDEIHNSRLDNMKLSDRSYRAIVERSLLRAKLQDLLASRVPTTGLVADVQLIQTETEQNAVAAMERIEAGEDFAIVAQEVSTDTVTAEGGGNVGWVTTEQLSARYGEELAAFVFSQEVGKLGIVESNGMFYVVLVQERDENGPLPSDVLTQRQNSALFDWLEERKSSPDVEIERLLEPEQIPPDPFTTTQGF